MKKKSGPKVLFIDIETSPLLSYTWGLFDQNVGLNQIHTDTHILSWSAKWAGEGKEVMYMDQRFEKDIENDKKIVKAVWQLLDEADIVIGQNHRRFDIKRLNARFIEHGLTPPSSYKTIDTLVLAKKYFGFTSNKLEYMTGKFNVKYKKLTHKKFPGFELWKECLAGNREAWNSMEEYNKYDVLSLEELYNKLAPWDNSINFNLYSDEVSNTCKCGSTEFSKNGFSFTNIGKFQRYKCKKCGSETKDRTNLFSEEKRKSLRVKV